MEDRKQITLRIDEELYKKMKQILLITAIIQEVW